MTFTFGPPGGLLYPVFLRLGALVTMLLPPTIIDFWILSSVPRILAPLSQVPGPPTAVTITSVGAPLMLTMLALAVVSLAAAGRSGRRRRLKLVFVWLLTAAAVAIPLGIVLVGAVWSPADGGAGIHEALSGRKARLTATAVYVAAVVGFSFVPYGVILTVWAWLLETKAPLDRFFRRVVVGSVVLSLPGVLTIARYVSEESSDTSAPLVGAIAVTCVTALLLPRILLPPLRSGAFALPPAGEVRA